jgi:hypothetical protein
MLIHSRMETGNISCVPLDVHFWAERCCKNMVDSIKILSFNDPRSL